MENIKDCNELVLWKVEVPQEKLNNSLTKTEIEQLEGGLGGTTYQGEEHGDAYEGVDITLVRSPPMAGKTALAQLLEHSLLQSDEVKKGLKRVFRISLLWMERDDVQKIYKPENEEEPRHGGNVFWNSFKRILQLSGLHIVAFASYGHYGAYTARGDHAIMDILPCSLQKSNTWGFEDVCFTREEFNSYFNYFCEKNLQMLKEEDIPPLSCYVSEITALHPGLVASTMNQIHMRFVKHTFERLTFAKVFAYLKSRDFNDHFKDIRAMPKITDMLDEEKRIADTVLFKKGGLEILTNAIPLKSRIIKTNILVDTGMTKAGYSTINFPAPLLRATYLQNRFGSVTRSKSPPNSFKDFIISVFAKMSSKVLQKSLGVGNDCRLLERVWQMEFYRASMQVLPVDIYAFVDVGEIFGSVGYLDFYINDQRNWAIELLRDGDKLQEHQQRFRKDGLFLNIQRSGQLLIFEILMYPDGSNGRVQLLGEEENLLGYDILEFLDDPT
ncbi:11773_t:CDS:2 [Acaulospora colombiana]|uniref:11773_t:CDS:1 n=1 Tax=Acaulospora colombiana TaxID=27376 RepID=A0ACA9M364_9GLOM|nr:11773_t:CDS:2 [Acaulospora colombiana]